MEVSGGPLRPTRDEALPLVRISETTGALYDRRTTEIVVLTADYLMAARGGDGFKPPAALFGDDPRAALRAMLPLLTKPLDVALDEIDRLDVAPEALTDGFGRSRKGLRYAVTRTDGEKVRKFDLPLVESLFLLDALADLLGGRLVLKDEVGAAIEAREARIKERAQALNAENRAKAGTIAKPRPVAGLMLCAIGLALLLAWPVLFKLENWIPVTLAIFAGVPLGAMSFGLGRRMRAPPYEAMVARDPRPPILYLRSFGSDDVQIPDRPGGMLGYFAERMWNRAWMLSLPGTAVAWLVRVFWTVLGHDGNRFEEQLARGVRRLGPMVAIGRPGESVAAAGAARAYLSDDNWQEFVLARIAGSRGVLLQIETTAGTWWEFGQCIRQIPRERLVLLLTARFGSLQRFDEIRLLAQRTLGLTLPRHLAGSAFVTFDRDGSAQGHPIVWHPFLLAWLMPGHVNVRRSLAPVLAHLNT